MKYAHNQASRVWLCPNLVCRHKGHHFKRKDLLVSHRKRCDPRNSGGDQSSLLPDIVDGSDREVQRWMDAAKDLRKEVKRLLRTGIPWSLNLLKPVYLSS